MATQNRRGANRKQNGMNHAAESAGSGGLEHVSRL